MKKIILLFLITCFVLPGCAPTTGITKYQAKNVRKFNRQKWRKKRDRSIYPMKIKDK